MGIFKSLFGKKSLGEKTDEIIKLAKSGTNENIAKIIRMQGKAAESGDIKTLKITQTVLREYVTTEKYLAAGETLPMHEQILIADAVIKYKDVLSYITLAGVKMDAKEFKERYKQGERNFKNADLRNADLSWANLTEIDFENADLSNVSLKGCTLVRANFKKANLQSADLSGATLQGADLSDANLLGANMNSTYTLAAILTGTTLPDGTKNP